MIKNNYTAVEFDDEYDSIENNAFHSSEAFNQAVISIKFKGVGTIGSSAFHKC
jgi:hypothetical protein